MKNLKRLQSATSAPLPTKGLQPAADKQTVNEIRLMDKKLFIRHFGLTRAQFDLLLLKVGPLLRNKPSHNTKLVHPSEMLAFVLRLLVHGDKNSSQLTPDVRRVVQQTCSAIYKGLDKPYLESPNVQQNKAIANDYMTFYKFPNCIGAMDARKILMVPQKGSNKSQLSAMSDSQHSLPFTALAATVDVQLRFKYVHIDKVKSLAVPDSFRCSFFFTDLDTKALEIPPPSRLPGGNGKLCNNVFVTEGFPLRRHVLKPYSSQTNLNEKKANFNERIYRIIKVAENAFGVFQARWRIFENPLNYAPTFVTSLTRAAVCLHNFLITNELAAEAEESKHYCPPHFVDYVDSEGRICDGEWRAIVAGDSGMQKLGRITKEWRTSFPFDLTRNIEDLTQDFEAGWYPGNDVSTRKTLTDYFMTNK